MRRSGFVAASVLALAACAPQVPDSGAGVGFGSYNDYAARQAQIRAERNMQLADANTIRPPEVTGAPQASAIPTTGVSSAELAAAGIGVNRPAAPAAEPVITPAPGAPMAMAGGTESSSVLFAEMALLEGDLIEAASRQGADEPSGGSASGAWETALVAAQRLGCRMSELRALTRLCRAAPADARPARVAELGTVLATFTEGETTGDLMEAREVLASA